MELRETMPARQYPGVEQAPAGPFLHEAPITNPMVYEVARHEAMHALVDLDNLVEISAYPDGNALGWTLVRESTDAVAAAGIVHGDGYGSDMRMIAMRALSRGESPTNAISSAVAEARMKLATYHPDLINIVARGLANSDRVLSGDRFRGLVAQAESEIRYKEQFGSLPKFEMDEKTDDHIEQNIEIAGDDSPYAHVPNEGKFALTVYGEGGYTVEHYEDGELVSGEIWALVEDDEDDIFQTPRYERKCTLNISLINRPKSFDIFRNTRGK